FRGGMALAEKFLGNLEIGKVRGGQLEGEGRATLRCNFAAMAAHLGLTVQDFSEIETCYSPPLAPVSDPVTIAGQALLRTLRRPLTKAPTTRSNSRSCVESSDF